MIDTKRLRQKILDLAIRGKLVPQDPDDEPASILLERIREEKLQMVAEGKLKKKDIAKDSVIFFGDDNCPYEKVGDDEPICIDDEIPYELPSGWCWARLGNIGQWQSGATPKTTNISYYKNGAIPWLVTGDLNDSLIKEIPGRITELALKETSVKLNPQGSLLIAMYGATIGKLGILTFPATTNQACCACSPIFQMNVWYMFYFLESSRTSLVERGIGGAQKNISKEIIVGTLIPIPPLAEQQRIVAALDKYLALVDEIERNQEELESLLAKARSKVLDLAIRGKLVPQDPNDEPASVLLERIREEKLQMVAEGKLKKKDVARDSVIYKGEDNSYYERFADGRDELLEEGLFELPDGWEWTRLGVVTDYGRAISADPRDIPIDAWILDLEDIEKGTGRVLKYLTLGERSSASTKRPFKKGQLLYSKLRPYLNKVLTAPGDGFCTSEILPVQTYGEISPDYLRILLMSNFFLSYANQCSYGVKMPRLGTKDGQSAFVPLPPLTEQNRIAQKAEEIRSILALLLSVTM